MEFLSILFPDSVSVLVRPSGFLEEQGGLLRVETRRPGEVHSPLLPGRDRNVVPGQILREIQGRGQFGAVDSQGNGFPNLWIS